MQTLPQIVEQYINTGKVRYEFRDFPLHSIHPNAQKAAEAARCAGAQGAYWEMHDLLFQKQGNWAQKSTATDIFKEYAEQLELDAAQFNACLDDGEFAAAVEADLRAGIAAGVRGTPGFFINDQFLSGAYPFEAFQQIIDAELQK